MQGASSVFCPECGLVLSDDQLDVHLRSAHRLYRFRGCCAPLGDTLAALLSALCQPQPEPDAFALLEGIAREEYGRRAAGFLATSLGQVLSRADPQRLPEICAAVAAAVAGRPSARAVTMFLAHDASPAARHLALTLAARLPPPLERRLVRALRPLLRDRTLTADLQLTAAAALLRTTGGGGQRAAKLLRNLIAGTRKVQALARLRRLEELSGPSPVLQELCRRLEAHIRMRCPRCGVKKRRAEMVEHLWAKHRLVLHGQKARDPWQLIGEWLDAARQHNDDEAVKRCRTFAMQVDPQDGLHRVQRLILAHGIEDAEARRELLAEAAELRASLCPHCYGLVPVPPDEVPRPMSVYRGRLSLRGYRVEVSDDGLFPWVEVETPAGLRQRRLAPGRRLTVRGAILFLAGPPVLLALVLALINPGIPPLPTVAGLLLAALGLYVAARVYWRPEVPADHRAVDHAWSWLAPRLHAEGFSLEDSAFLASLAGVSLTRGTAEARRPVLERLLRLTERVVGAGFGGARYLAALRRLAIADAVRAGKDRVLLVVAEVDNCFQGKLPLAYAEGLLEGWQNDGWSAAELARLRALLCDSAFEAGFEVRNLIDAGETAPSLGALLSTDDTLALAQLRLLWSLRASRPWDRHGNADTVFDLAADSRSFDVLARHPDLLLRHQLPERFADDGGADILMTSRGVALRGVLLTRPPRCVEVAARRSKGYELVVDEQRLSFTRDPEPVAARLERWCRFYFDEFLPQVADVHRWKSPDASAVLRAWGAVRCPDCHQSLLPMMGEVGVSLEE